MRVLGPTIMYIQGQRKCHPNIVNFKDIIGDILIILF